MYFATKYPQELGFEAKVTKVQDSASKRWTGQQTRQFKKQIRSAKAGKTGKGAIGGVFP